MNVAKKPDRDSDRLGLVSMLCDHSACGIVVIDSKKKIRALTPPAARLLGVTGETTVGGPTDILPAALLRVMRSALAGKLVEDRQITIPTNHGEATLRITAVPLVEDKADSGVVLVFGEVLDRDLEQKIRRLDRLASIGTLSATTAHEMKNALVAIKTFVDLLLEKNKDSELAEIVRREMRRISAMVSQTLKYASPGKTSFTDISLHEILDHSLRIVQPQFEKKLISFKRSFQAAPDVVHGDGHQLEQAFVNLFLNALEAMGASGSLSVATEVIRIPPREPAPSPNHGPQLQVTIADTGIGIKPENMGRLFEPFFTTKDQGTGLGLVIAQRIVEEHRGKIAASSEMNKGTTFQIVLPVRSAAAV